MPAGEALPQQQRMLPVSLCPRPRFSNLPVLKPVHISGHFLFECPRDPTQLLRLQDSV